MKKKMQEQKEEKIMTHNEEPDNKDNTQDQITPGNDGGGTGEGSSAENAANGADATGTASDKVVNEVRAVEEKLAEMQDKYIRLSAEFDNYRKRTLKEKMDLSKYAEENLLSKIIPFMDDFERALQHIETSQENQALKSGIDLIYSKFSEFLKQNGINEIEALGKDFDVDVHEAVAKAPAEEGKKGKIVDVVLKGYFLRDKVLRFAKVVVGE